MNEWLERVKHSIFPRSIERQDIRKALQEWFYTGDCHDLEQPIEDCELCGHPDIRYQFTILNRNTKEILLIGSECVTRFDIPALGKDGVILSTKETKKVVSKDRRKLITNAKERRMIQALIELKKKEEDFNIDSFISYYKDRGAFTPKQLSVLFWRFDKYDIERCPADFKLTIKRNREKEQLLALKDFQIQAILPCLSPTQRSYLERNR